MAMRLVPVATALLFAATAHAWSSRTTEHDLTPQLVKGKLDGPIASLTARYVIPIEGETYGLAFGGMAMPPVGVVTGAVARFGGAEHVLAIEDAEAAAKKFDDLSVEEKPGRGEKRSAVILSGESGSVSLGIAAAHGGVLTLELSVRVPTCFFRDVRYVAMPASWAKVTELALRTKIAKDEDIDAACGTRIQSNRGDGTESSSVWIGT